MPIELILKELAIKNFSLRPWYSPLSIKRSPPTFHYIDWAVEGIPIVDSLAWCGLMGWPCRWRMDEIQTFTSHTQRHFFPRPYLLVISCVCSPSFFPATFSPLEGRQELVWLDFQYRHRSGAWYLISSCCLKRYIKQYKLLVKLVVPVPSKILVTLGEVSLGLLGRKVR